MHRCFALPAATLVALCASSPVLADQSAEWTTRLRNLRAVEAQTLLRIARDWYPHEALSDSHYIVCIEPYETAASDPQQKAQIDAALGMAEAGSRRMGYASYLAVSDEEERVRLARNLADGPWMRKFRLSVAACLEAQPEVKARLDPR
jgi:hypothetical protein